MYHYDSPASFPRSQNLGQARAERVLGFVTTWGRNASPFSVANIFLQWHWPGITYWRYVSKAAKSGREFVKRIDGLERGARALKKATDEQASAQAKLPSYPLQSAEKAGHIIVTRAELDYVEKYFNTASLSANDASAARRELVKAISGWDAAVAQADQTRDFTRKLVSEAINYLDLRFSDEGGSFRAYLVNARDTAAEVESWARMKQYHAAHILGKGTPDGYVPPTPW